VRLRIAAEVFRQWAEVLQLITEAFRILLDAFLHRNDYLLSFVLFIYEANKFLSINISKSFYQDFESFSFDFGIGKHDIYIKQFKKSTGLTTLIFYIRPS
jgi:hypothetical protein